jgi:Spy/CpxP family protein refolding chaperone
MKKATFALIAATCLVTGIATANAEHRGDHGPDMERMAILLDLNESQKTEVEKILNEQREKFRAEREQYRAQGTRPTREEMMQKHAELRQETLTKLQNVLTPEQIKKFEALTDHRPHRFRARN